MQLAIIKQPLNLECYNMCKKKCGKCVIVPAAFAPCFLSGRRLFFPFSFLETGEFKVPPHIKFKTGNPQFH